MKTVITSGDYQILDHTFHITPWKKGEQYYHEILQKISEQLEAMLTYHSRVLVIRYDLHLSEAHEYSGLISKLLKQLNQVLKRKYNHLRMGYVWCREQHLSNKQHYHLALMLNGDKFMCSYTVTALIDEIWTSLGQPLTYKPEDHYYFINRGEEKVARKAFKRMAYLAKVRTKGQRNDTANDYSTSRIKPKWMLH